MRTAEDQSNGRATTPRTAVQNYARMAGILLLLTFVAGGFGESYVPEKLIVSTDAAATAENFRTFDALLRWGIAGYFVEALCDVALALIFYVLLKPVSNGLALLAAFFGLVATAVYVVAELFLFMPSIIVGGAAFLNAFSRSQLDALALLSVKYYGFAGALSIVFYGTAWVIRGCLIFLSGYIPRILGVLMMLGGLAFIARTITLVLWPAYSTATLLLLMAPGGLLLALWLLVRGIDASKWEAKASAT